MQIDIDDVFVGAAGTRLLAVDVEALVQAQQEWRQQFVDNFHFTIGFSGDYFGHGDPAERDGDTAFLGALLSFVLILLYAYCRARRPISMVATHVSS